MRLIDRERIEGTVITIGRRVAYKDGRVAESDRYAAEYRDSSGKQVTENLGTGSRLEARKNALAIHARLQQGQVRIADSRLGVAELIDSYFSAVKARGVARKTEWKYRADLDKLKKFCKEQKIVLAVRFGREPFYRYREWLFDQEYEPKTVHGALVLCKQVFKWGHTEGFMREYPLGCIKLTKAKANPQPCFTTEQVEKLIEKATGIERAAIATLGYAGLRIGEVEQMQWTDVRFDGNGGGMFHIRRGGSNGTTKDKDERFVPIHPRVAPLVAALSRSSKLVFPGITERQLLQRVKNLCAELGFASAEKFKLHSFRHHFASLCANHQVAHRKALAWLGHSSSDILELYYHLTDEESQSAMRALAGDAERVEIKSACSDFEGNLRAIGQSKIETELQVQAEQFVIKLLGAATERPGFEPGVRV
ncbi:MAG TPA: site-specific integrase [Tepidisphaeraceae bacterium]